MKSALGDACGVPCAQARSLVDVSADGLVLVDDDGRVSWSNDAARHSLGVDGSAGEMTPALQHLGVRAGVGELRRSTWTTPDGRRRHLDHRSAAVDGGVAVWLSDVTESVRQQERITAITRAAASVADTYSLRATLDAVAGEVACTAGIAAVQIHAYGNPDAPVRVLGMAGFGDAPDFTERLAACRRLGVRMMSIESFIRRERVVVLHRKSTVMADPAWGPLHEIMGRPAWDTFVAVPLCVRGRVLGAMNVYYEVGEDPGSASLSFLDAMADHAAVAMDTATLLARTRMRARSDERRRLARDLHDSAVQQVFSLRMRAEALLAQLPADGPGHGDVGPDVRCGLVELAGLAANALGDLRALLTEMRPFDVAHGGLVAAVTAIGAGLHVRHGVDIEVAGPVDRDLVVAAEVQEDLFRVVQEALHNVIKHAAATCVTVDFRQPQSGDDLVVEIGDDGRGQRHDPSQTGSSSGADCLGLTSMRERLENWGGRLEAGPRPAGGWLVRAVVPAEAGVDLL